MYYEVYIDSLFGINLMLNLMMLNLAAKIIKCTATHLSILLGAIFGALSECLLIVLIPLPLALRLILAYGFISILMVQIGLRIRNREMLCKSVFVLFLLTFAFGGMMEFIGNQFAFFGVRKTTIISVLFVGSIVTECIEFTVKKWKQQKIHKIYKVQIWQDGKTMKTTALLDTGNGLFEPISGKPVSIVEQAMLQMSGIRGREENYRLIPFHSIGKEHGRLDGFLVDKIVVWKENNCIVCEKAMLGIYEGKISTNGKYQMILHPKLLEN